MLKKNIKNAIEKELYKQAELLNFPVLQVSELYDNFCEIRIPNEQNKVHPGMAYHLVTQLTQVKGVKKATDAGMSVDGSCRRIEVTVGPDCWTHTEEDAKAFNNTLKRYFDPDLDKRLKEKEEKERLKHWRDYILPLPETPKHYTTELFLTMAYEPYDWIKNGEKTTEFRAYTPAWNRRLLSHPLDTVRFQRGYGGAGRPIPEQMTFKIKKISLYDIHTGKETDPYNPDKIIPTHFAIDLDGRVK